MKAPQFGELTFGDAGVYVCEVSMGGITRHQSFELVVEGQCVCVCVTQQAKSFQAKAPLALPAALGTETYCWLFTLLQAGKTL